MENVRETTFLALEKGIGSNTSWVVESNDPSIADPRQRYLEGIIEKNKVSGIAYLKECGDLEIELFNLVTEVTIRKFWLKINISYQNDINRLPWFLVEISTNLGSFNVTETNQLQTNGSLLVHPVGQEVFPLLWKRGAKSLFILLKEIQAICVRSVWISTLNKVEIRKFYRAIALQIASKVHPAWE